ncbi:hypothetical protein D5086_017594 [Populus alba]|uniref:Uncharacterized protein n=1 Tax=Populus alba TaxID=43335 RepID=A0ACC4BNS8_POPAL
MGKNEKTRLGRALVKHHNQMIQESKEKGQFYKSQHKKVLESFTDVTEIDAVMEQVEEGDLFSSSSSSVHHPVPNLLIKLDTGSGVSDMTAEEKREKQKKEEALHASSLRVPRRQLVMVVDARDPLFYRCPDLEAYAREIDEHKRTLLLVNKADLLPFSVRQKWADYFRHLGILFLFWSAKAATAVLEGKILQGPWNEQATLQEMDDPDTKIYGRDELLARLQSEAETIVRIRSKSVSSGSGPSNFQSSGGNFAGNSAPKHVVVGFVGYPNVGLVFPSFSSSRYEMIASGVLPIDRMTEHREAVQVVANRVPRHVIEDVYKINLPKPKPYELQSRPPLASELLRTYCASRGYVASSGLPDETRAARQILKDYIDGKLTHHEIPPGISDEEGSDQDDAGPSLSKTHQSDSSDTENPAENDGKNTPALEHVLDDLNSFDMANGLAHKKVTVKKPSASASASHKHHKKPQKKKDRSWRIENDGGDGMPVVRVFQKSVNTGPLKTG